MTATFADMGLRLELVTLLRHNGLARPTPVQEQTIPVLLSGRDAIAQAQTGTGKTLAFVLPILEKVNPDLPQVQALIVTPTRELAIQITAEVEKLSAAVKAHVLAVYGGQDVEGQIRKLQGAAQIVIGTPGRLLDHLGRGTVDLSAVSFLVLDEADQMLDMGFLNEVEAIIRKTPGNRQTALLSATMPDSVRRLAAGYMKHPEDIRIQGKRITLEGIAQIVVRTTDRAKQQTLLHLLEKYRPYLAVVFCRTKIRAKKLTEALLSQGVNVDELHGDLTQAKREQVMKRFRDARLQILVATDVAARGLDIEGITHVFNYDIPHDAESYIHRIGRTGRAGQKGMAITLAAPRDTPYLEKIERGIGAGLKIETVNVQTASNAEGTPERTAPENRTAAKRGGRSTSAQRRGGERRGGRGREYNVRDERRSERRGSREPIGGQSAGRGKFGKAEAPIGAPARGQSAGRGKFGKTDAPGVAPAGAPAIGRAPAIGPRRQSGSTGRGQGGLSSSTGRGQGGQRPGAAGGFRSAEQHTSPRGTGLHGGGKTGSFGGKTGGGGGRRSGRSGR